MNSTPNDVPAVGVVITPSQVEGAITREICGERCQPNRRLHRLTRERHCCSPRLGGAGGAKHGWRTTT
jgi:hypothetical protein